MIVRPYTLTAPIFLQAIVCLVSCTAPQSGRPLPGRSAAFLSHGEPWEKDLVRSVAPVYSHDNRAAYRQGSGVFHVSIDWSTGSVLQVTVKKSTGYASLDSAAIRALQQWQFRPASWRILDIPVDFKMANSHQDYYEKVRKAQQQQRQL